MSDFAERINRLSPEKRELLLERLRRTAEVAESPARIPRRADPGCARLSYAQQRLWFLDQLGQQRSGYQIVGALRILSAAPTPVADRPVPSSRAETPGALQAMSARQRLSAAALQQSLQTIVQRHEVLRTVFRADGGEPRQVIQAESAVPLPVVDWRTRGREEREAALQRLLDSEQWRPFDLAHGPLLRAQLVRLADDEHVLVVALHHIVADGWSSGILRRELAECYRAYSAGEAPRLPELTVQYADFAEWQRSWLRGEVLDRQLAYWRHRLADLPTLQLPTDYPPPAISRGHGGAAVRWLGQPLLERLSVFNRREGVTLYMTMLAAFQIVLARYSGQTDVVVGTPLANRNHREIEELIGFFVNTLVMRADLSGRVGFREAVHRVRETAVQAYAHQDLPFERLVEELHPERYPQQNPLFQVAFAVQNAPQERLEMAGLLLEPLIPEVTTARFQLELHVWEHTDGLRLVAAYDRDRFRSETITGLLGQLEMLLQAALEEPEREVWEHSLVSPAQRRQLLVDFNATQADYPRQANLADLFSERRSRQPQNAAVVDGDEVWSYGELGKRVEELSRRLRHCGVSPDVPVGLAIEPSLNLVAATLAIVQAGGAYVPLDPDAPPSRWAQVLASAGVAIVVTQASLLYRVPPLPRLQVVPIDGHARDAGSKTPARRPLSADNLAYVMYTSGSTGTPKGVAVPHRAVARLVLNTNYVQIVPEDVVALAANFAFDAATFELWGALLNGARLVITRKEMLLSARTFTEHVQRHGVRIAFLTTALFHHLARQDPAVFSPLRCLLFGGEAADPDSVRAVLSAGPPARLANVYGPTECTTFATYYPIERLAAEAAAVPIGRPVANTQAYVLDEHMNLAAIGAPGELCLGGDGLARGYQGDPRLTAQRFVPHPCSNRPGERLYATGDLVRYREDGTLEFLGRRDQQVKLRGFRIELGEIEAILRRHPAVEDAAVLLQEDSAGDRRLLAFVQSGDPSPATCEAILRFARDALPLYMVPAAVVGVERLPLTPQGKIDREALAKLPAQRGTASPQDGASFPREPRTPVETAVAEVYAELLKQERVPTDASFFDLGGHSLLATQLASRLRDIFQLDLPLATLFRFPSVAELSTQIERQLGSDRRFPSPPLGATQRDGTLPASFAQQRLWFLQRLDPAGGAWHVPMIAELRGTVDVSALQRSVNEIVRRHEALRTRFAESEGRPLQVICPTGSCPLRVVDLRHASEADQAKAVQERALAEQREPFDLQTGPLMRCCLLRLGEDRSVFCATLHHIVADGWSLGLLCRELAVCYAAFRRGRQPALPELPIQYADYAAWQLALLESDALQQQLAYWRTQMNDLPVLSLPTDRPRPASGRQTGARAARELSAALTQRLRALNRREGVTLYMSLLAVFQVLLLRLTGQGDVVVGTPIANRTRSELEGLIGFFVNSLVMRTDLSGDPRFRELLRRVRATALAAYAHQDLPFERLVEELNPERHLHRHPLFQVVFAVQNAPGEPLQLAGLEVRTVEFDVATTRYDLQFDVWELGDRLQLNAFYDVELFDRSTIECWLERFETLLSAILDDPDRRLSEYRVLTEDDRKWLADRHSRPAPAGDRLCLHEWFRRQAEQTPEAAAVVTADRQMTYRELDLWSNRLANRLRELGVVPETRVAICTERSAALVAGLLGILKAGGAYVPLDPLWPAARWADIVGESGASLVVTQQSLEARVRQAVAGGRDAEELPAVLPVDGPVVSRADAAQPTDLAGPDHLAYVLYTSGSTGRPKGVCVTHANVTRLMAVAQSLFAFGRHDAVALFHSTAFDFSVWELWSALLFGGRLAIVPYFVSRSPRDFRQWLIERQVTVLNQTPSAFAQLMAVTSPSDLPALRRLIFGGERLDLAVLGPWLDAAGENLELVNMYGITETTVHVTYQRLDASGGRHGSPIGCPLPDLRVYLLDEAGNLAPPGCPGELCVGGPGLARGYLSDPARTAEKFVPDPFGDRPGERLYRSGDRARYRSDGTLEFLGRSDQQVKVRGFRVEPGELELKLREHEAVRQAIVVLRDDVPGDCGLVAYVTAAMEQPSVRQRLSAEKDRLVDHWRELYDDVYRQPADSRDPSFNIVGWNSSYTGASLSADVMREQVEHTAARIRKLRGSDILEIGCGTGLLLHRLAPACDRYLATDVSAVALESLRDGLPGKVTLRLCEADDFSGIEPHSLDVVVLNSVVQYFPDLEYLERVLRRACQAVRPGGAVFVGDVRSLPLQAAFQTAVELFRAADDCSLATLRERVRTQMDQEMELLVDPDFFQQCAPTATVRIEPKRGRDQNELTQFRYDVTLRMGMEGPVPALRQWLDWRELRWSAAEIRRRLLQQQPRELGLLCVENARVHEAARAAQLLAELPGTATVAQLRQMVRDASGAQPGVDPEEIWSLAEELGCTAAVRWSGGRPRGDFDVAILPILARVGPAALESSSGVRTGSLSSARKSVETVADRWPAFPPSPSGPPKDYGSFPSSPAFRSRLAQELRVHLQQTLPDYMVPISVVVLDRMPLTSQGKIDRRALPPPDTSRPLLDAQFELPQSPLETSLAGIWSEVLRLRQVGRNDNFFDLGGHSLLATQVVARIRDACQVELPLRTLFESPTIAQLAAAIARQKAAAADPDRLAVSLARMESFPSPGAPGGDDDGELIESRT